MALQTTGIIYLGIDPVSGRYRYYNLDTSLSSFSDAPPTAAQEQHYKEEEAANAAAEAKLQPPPTQDTVANQIASTEPNAAAANAKDPNSQLTPEETAKLKGATNEQKPGETGGTSSAKETALADPSPFGPNAKNYDFSKMTPEQIAATGKLGGGPNPNPDSEIKGPIDNPLHNYASYTYGLSLHMLSKDDYN